MRLPGPPALLHPDSRALGPCCSLGPHQEGFCRQLECLLLAVSVLLRHPHPQFSSLLSRLKLLLFLLYTLISSIKFKRVFSFSEFKN